MAIARREGCTLALLKEKSPSCGKGRIYDGSFTGTLTEGNGICAALLMENGIEVLEVQIRADHTAAIALCSKWGFETIGTFRRFLRIDGVDYDAVLMNLYL